MVIGIATGLLGLGLALPTGLAFGYGYGYGVRQGYSAFKPPSATANSLKMSPDPIQGSFGMGLQTAEERTNVKTPVGPIGRPSLQSQAPALMGTPNVQSSSNPQKFQVNKHGIRRDVNLMSREEFRKFVKGEYPYNKSVAQKKASGPRSRRSRR